MSETSIPSRISAKEYAGLIVVLCLAAVQVYCVGRVTGTTFDEPVYLQCGLKGWRESTHKPLMRLGTMPLPVDLATFPLVAREWLGHLPWTLQEDFTEVLHVARAASLVFWLILLVVVFGLTRHLAGPLAGWVGLGIVALEPSLVGHASLATTDVASVGSILLAWWIWLTGRNAGPWRRWVLPGIAYGFALFAKASALAFVPLLILASDCVGWFGGQINPDRAGIQNWIRERAKLFLVGLISVFIFVGSDWTTEPTFVRWAEGLPAGGFANAMMWLSENLHVFTNAGEGLAQQIKHNLRGHGAYLVGHEAPRAFAWYFPTLLTIKMTTAGLLVFVAAAVAWILRSGTGRNGRLLVPVALLLLFSLNCRVQIGIRLVFPLLVLAYLCGAVWLAECWQRGSRWIRVAVCLALAAHAAESALAYPHGLMFANTAWSTFAAPDYLMSDSNYDWGQGLPDLEQEGVEQARTGPIDLVYFGADPAANDVSCFRRLQPAGHEWNSPQAVRERLAGKTIAVGATVVHGPPLGPAYEQFRLAILGLPRRKVGCMQLITFPNDPVR